MPLPTIPAAPTAPQRSDLPNVFVDKADAFLAWVEALPDQLNAYLTALVTYISGQDFNATSTSSVTIGTGSKSFNVGADKLYQIGQFIIAASTSAPSKYMRGQITNYSDGMLTIAVPAGGTSGSGTVTAWSISLAPDLLNFATLTGSATLTNKVLDLADNTVSMTLAQLNAAVTDADVVSIEGAQTILNKTIGAGLKYADYTIVDAAGVAIDPTNGPRQTWTLGASRTPTASGWEDGHRVELLVTAGANAITWGTFGVTWIGGSAPSLDSSGATLIELWQVGGAKYGRRAVTNIPTIITDIIEVGSTTAFGANADSGTMTINVSLTGLTGGIASAPAAGDYVVAVLAASYASDLDLSCTSAGYIELVDLYANSSFLDLQLGVYAKLLSAAETTVSFSVPPGYGSTYGYAVLVKVFRGVDPTTPLDVAVQTSTGANTVIPAPPSISPASNTTMGIVIGAGAHNAAAASYATSGISNVIQSSATTTNKVLAAMGTIKNPVSPYNPMAFGFSGIDATNFSSAAVTLVLRRA